MMTNLEKHGRAVSIRLEDDRVDASLARMEADEAKAIYKQRAPRVPERLDQDGAELGAGALARAQTGGGGSHLARPHLQSGALPCRHPRRSADGLAQAPRKADIPPRIGSQRPRKGS